MIGHVICNLLDWRTDSMMLTSLVSPPSQHVFRWRNAYHDEASNKKASSSAFGCLRPFELVKVAQEVLCHELGLLCHDEVRRTAPEHSMPPCLPREVRDYHTVVELVLTLTVLDETGHPWKGADG